VSIIAIGTFLAGGLFGRFFKVWCLVPALALLFVIVFSTSAYYTQGMGRPLAEFAALAICLQTGFAAEALRWLVPSPWRRLMNPRVSRCQADTQRTAVRRHNIF
jgi:hypothetical protein